MNTKKLPTLSDLTSRWHIYHQELMSYAPRADKKNYEELRGQGDSRIYIYSMDEGKLWLHVSTDNPRRYILLRSIPGLHRYTNSILKFNPDLLDTVAIAIKAKKKRVLSPELRERLRNQLAAIKARKNPVRNEQNMS